MPSPTSCFPDELHLRRTNPELHLPLDLCAMIAGLITDQAIASDRKLHIFLNGKFSAKQDLRGIAVEFVPLTVNCLLFFGSGLQIRMVFSVTALNARLD